MPRRLLTVGCVLLLLTLTACTSPAPERSSQPSAEPTASDESAAWETVVHVRHGTSTALGIAVTADGHILTSLVESDEVTVDFADGTSSSGTLVGDNEILGVRVVKVDDRPLPTARFGDASTLEAGDQLQLLGGDLASGPTVTAATVAAPVGDRGGRIEVTVAGPLAMPGSIAVANDGSVIGVLPRILDSGQGGPSTVVLLPATNAVRVAENLIAGVQPYLGVGVRNSPDGVLVEGVAADSPAERAGLRQGDIILEVSMAGADMTVQSAEDVAVAVAVSIPGDSLRIRYLRDGAASTTTATITTSPSATGAGG